MLTARTLKYLAVTTAVLFAAAGLIGDDNDVLWILDDVIFFGFILSTIALIALSAGVLVRHFSSSQRAGRSAAD
jgi:hypothetical protein